MKQIIVGMTVITMMLTLFLHANADLGFRSDTKHSAPDPAPIIQESSNPDYDLIPQNSINSTSKGIQLHFQDYPLGELLKNVHDETGIRFNLSPRMVNITVNVDIEAKNWKSSVRKLITDYSRVEVWTNRPKTSRIWLMESTLNN